MTEQHRGTPLYLGAAKAGISENTARKYLRQGTLPSQIKTPHDWRTRKDPFEKVADEITKLISDEPGLRATSILEHLQREHPGDYSNSLLRSLQRRLRLACNEWAGEGDLLRPGTRRRCSWPV